MEQGVCPDLLVIHLGENDLVALSGIGLLKAMKLDLGRIKERWAGQRRRDPYVLVTRGQNKRSQAIETGVGGRPSAALLKPWPSEAGSPACPGRSDPP
ncbi:hypothetical protein NDU88_000449 [Pleurodeles waltl]|uniref:Uncharacterized protein n=1 Tax=Pleurodeles waltl TaxID=8319 RepID=A0AAV7VYG1_PLEWA|nr:hypothetical protein NDU88_000449 [Pleurodeles waltl]